MIKKLILPALVLICVALFATNGIAQTCSGFTGQNVQVIAIGSSAQFNTFAFAAEAVLPTLSTYTGPINFWASSSWLVTDSRTGLTDGGGKIWVAWDSSSDCNVYAYMSFDSTVGVRSFSAWAKQTLPVLNAPIGAVYGATSNTFGTCTVGTVKNAGQPACEGNGGALPGTLQAFLTTPAGPTCKYTTGTNTTCTKTTTGALPYNYCGNTSTVQATAHYCFFNQGNADVRPDDALYATTRALGATFNAAPNPRTGLTTLGYGQSTCGAFEVASSAAKTVGCVIYEAFGQGASFNVAKFALSSLTAPGSDPYSAAQVPENVTINIGAAPVLVLVNDHDTSTAGFGNGAPNYTITNINHKVLAGFEDGTFGCVGDVNVSNNFLGAGNAVQVIQREPLSGTYNTFEFNAVRTLSGSASAAVDEAAATTAKWFTDDDSGQELNVNTSADVVTPSTNFGGSGCASSSSTVPSSLCGDPKYVPETHITCANGSPVQLRAIGTGEMVKATLNLEATQTSGSNPQIEAPNGLGYAFWGYGNFASAAGGCQTGVTGSVSCGSYLGHYLTVDGIDPLFTNPGGATAGPLTDDVNPNGGFHLPQCYLSSGAPTCYKLPFTHILDGSYPIWTILRAMTFRTTTTETTPAAVLNLIAQAENEANGAGSDGVLLDDFVPYFTSINLTNGTGNLNLGVYRTHYLNGTTIAANNGFTSAACSTFEPALNNIPISGVPGGCTVDEGGDVGGTVFTVQSDIDFNADWGTVVVGASAAAEIYALHQ